MMHNLGTEWFLLFGLSAGWLAGLIMGERGLGLVGSLIVGVLGALLGGNFVRIAGLHCDSMTASFLTSLAGSMLLLILIRLIRR